MVARIHWNEDYLVEIIRRRLFFASDGRIESLDAISEPYKRYLEKHFRDTFNLVGTPLRIELRTGKNPFAKSSEK